MSYLKSLARRVRPPGWLSLLVAILSTAAGVSVARGDRPVSPSSTTGAGFRPLFNGVDLTGWRATPAVHENLFDVHDGEIHVYRDERAGQEQPFAGLVSDESFSDYHLTLEYRWGEKKFPPRDRSVRDAGVLFHVHGGLSIWPNSVELQVQQGDVGDLWAIGTRVAAPVDGLLHAFSPGGQLVTRGSPESRFNRFPRGYCWERPGWNRIEIVARGDSAEFYVNDELVNRAEAMRRWDEAGQSYEPLNAGRLLLQAEGAEVSYRNLQIKRLVD